MVSSGGGERDARGALPRRLHRARPVDLQITRSLTTQRRPGPETSVVRGTAYGNAAAQTGSMLQGVPQDPPEKKPGDGGLCGSRSSEVPTGSNCIGSSPIHRRHRRCRLPQRALAGLRVYRLLPHAGRPAGTDHPSASLMPPAKRASDQRRTAARRAVISSPQHRWQSLPRPSSQAARSYVYASPALGVLARFCRGASVAPMAADVLGSATGWSTGTWLNVDILAVLVVSCASP